MRFRLSRTAWLMLAIVVIARALALVVVEPAPFAPRIMHRVYASAHGYYWLPCCICGRYMGGHEKRGRGELMTAPTRGVSVCARCKPEADRRNRAYLKALKSTPIDPDLLQYTEFIIESAARKP